MYMKVERETDAGLIVSGAKVVATGSAITNYNFIAHYGLPIKKREFALDLHGADGRAGCETDLPHVVLPERRGHGHPVRLPTVESHGRK